MVIISFISLFFCFELISVCKLFVVYKIAINSRYYCIYEIHRSYFILLYLL